MQVSILNGSFTSEESDFRTRYPRNFIPVPKSQGISSGYLRPGYGIVNFATGSGLDRGAINWNGVCYRVSGTKLVQVATNGTVTVLGDVGGSGQVQMDYSFDRLSVTSGGRIYYWNGTTLTQVTDLDAGTAKRHIWVDGYFMWNDSANLVVSELTDPTSVNPLKYGSSEIDPDPVMAVLKPRNEPHAVNRYSIESFYNNPNATANQFPFSRIDGAHMTKGAVGTFACCVFEDLIAFVGGGRNESIGVYAGRDGSLAKLSTQEIDQILNSYSEGQLSSILCEEQIHENHKLLHVHLPDRTLVYDMVGSQAVGEPVWFELGSGVNDHDKYRARNMVWCYDKWIVGDPNSSAIGYLTSSLSSHWGDDIRWEFNTGILYNESRGGIINEIELVCLSGRSKLGDDPSIWISSSDDGETWSQPRFVDTGKQGNRTKRIRMTGGGKIGNWKILKGTGSSDAHLSIARLEIQVTPLLY